MAILTLTQNWGFSQTNKPVTNRIKLGDGYSLDTFYPDSYREEWSLTGNGLNASQMNTYVTFLENCAGVEPFQWRPLPTASYKNFWCTSFSVVGEAPDLWKISLTIQEAR